MAKRKHKLTTKEWKKVASAALDEMMGAKMPGADITKNFVRDRQFSPKQCARGSFRMKKISKDKMLVICCPRGPKHWSKRSKQCKVGTRVQSILTRRT